MLTSRLARPFIGLTVFLFACDGPGQSQPPNVNVQPPNVTIQPPTVIINPPPDMMPPPPPPVPVIRFGVLENGADNYVLWYDKDGKQLQRIPTRGFGGAGGNANALAVSPDGQRLVAVNTMSNNVSVFKIENDGSLAFLQIITTGTKPVSVGFEENGNHLYVLGDTLESFPRYGFGYSSMHDGVTTLPNLGPAQVGYVTDGLSYAKIGVSFKGDDTIPSGAFTLYDLRGGVVTNSSTSVALPAGDNKTPFGFATFGDGRTLLNLAHANKNTLLYQNQVVNTKASTQASNCWTACYRANWAADKRWQRTGQCWTANTPAMTLSALHVEGDTIVMDREPAVTLTNGRPSDISVSSSWLIARVNNGTNVALNLYTPDEGGALVPAGVINLAPIVASAANGALVYEAADYGR